MASKKALSAWDDDWESLADVGLFPVPVSVVLVGPVELCGFRWCLVWCGV